MRNKPDMTSLASARRRRALSLTEVLVALAISLVFVGSVVTAYIQISRAADRSEAEVRAHVRARTAVDTIARDIRRIRTDPTIPDQEFRLVSSQLAWGDNIDNDGDGAIDEEVIDGFDNDSDWSFADDNHARFGAFAERADYLGVPDLGDFKVNEDFLFSRDVLTFRVPADPMLGAPAQRITYRVGTFEDEDHVLLREVTTNPGFLFEQTTIEPLVFQVVSFDILAWNANDDVSTTTIGTQRPYWQQDFDSQTIQFPDVMPIGAPFGTPPFEFPAAVFIGVTVSAESQPLSEIGGWPIGSAPLRTMTLTTVVCIDEVIKSPIYRDYVRPRV